MKRSALFLSLAAFGPLACGDDKADSDSNTNTNTSSASGILTLPPMSTSDGSTSDGTTTSPTTTEAPTTSDSGSGSTTFDPLDCGEAVINIPIVTPSVMLVLDKSGSMITPPGPNGPGGYWDHDGDDADDDGLQDADMMTPATPKITRWNSLYNVVDFIVGAFDNSMNLGAVLFPSKTAIADYSAAACPVNMTPEVKVGPMNGQAILNAIPAATDTTLKGGTPAAKGITTAVAELEAAPADQPKFMIFVTDGAANCAADAPDNNTLFEVYDEGLPAAVADALAKGIPTYVVGIAIQNITSPAAKDGNPDSTNPFERLNEVADAGGKPRPGETKFYDTQNQVELQSALEEISMQILSCTLALDPTPKYPDYVEVTVSGTAYGNMQVTDCATESGWMYTSPEMNEIVLCGQACTDFQTTGNLDAQYRCPNSG